MSEGRTTWVLRFEEPRGPQPPPSGGPLFAFAHCASHRRLLPEYIIDRYCDSPSRAVRRRPTAADCYLPKARAALRRRRTASPRAAESQKIHRITKKARKLLYDSIIRTTFGTAIRRERRESHCYHRKSGILQSDGNKRMSRRVVTTPDW